MAFDFFESLQESLKLLLHKWKSNCFPFSILASYDTQTENTDSIDI